MATLAVATSSPPNVEGGHLVIARSLVAALRECGHDAHLLVTPDYGFGRTSKSYLTNWFTHPVTPDGRSVDQVVSLRYPSYAIRHRAHVCWLNHTMREYYDGWTRFASTISWRARAKERVRKTAIHAADWWLLHRNVSEVVAQSATIRDRLRNDLGVDSDVLLPPPPQRAYRCDGYDEYIFTVSRLTPLKRIDLLVRALAEPEARRVKVVIGGEGEERDRLEWLAASIGVASRVAFLGRISDEVLLHHLGGCRAVCFPPLDEDYGLVTAEAFASRKAVVTCTDSGGATELVRDGENGLVCEPTPASLAAALGRLTDDRSLAERFGECGATRAAAMTWAAAVKKLVIV